MELRTERLTLVPLGSDHFETTHRYASDAEANRYMLHLPNRTEKETKDFLLYCEQCWIEEHPTDYEFAVLLDGEQIGGANLCLEDGEKTAELGWILDRRYWGKGYATETAKELMRFGREELGIRTFIAHCDAENVKSEAVMKRVGMNFVSQYGGRKNHLSDEEREEKEYRLDCK
ncbi:MAG: GNAT family N-acetyltransferase [Oscillospiraceae bacterium]|nr:GNAT family N-acetyltransferase [Oscillospiraceae bacterium]